MTRGALVDGREVELKQQLRFVKRRGRAYKFKEVVTESGAGSLVRGGEEGEEGMGGGSMGGAGGWGGWRKTQKGCSLQMET